jgi:hypothetical protein
MGFFDLLWIFFIFSALQPALQQRLLEMRRLRLLAQLERQRGSRAIALVHREETMSLCGFPLMCYININDSEEVLRAIQLTAPRMPIDLILHTPGGLVLAAGQIAHALRAHQGKITVFVPHYAMSGGTLIALDADAIVMDENAVLGPMDPQLGQWPAASILTAHNRPYSGISPGAFGLWAESGAGLGGTALGIPHRPSRWRSRRASGGQGLRSPLGSHRRHLDTSRRGVGASGSVAWTTAGVN